jgi:hypothetical protein
MRCFLPLLALIYASGAAAQGRLLDPGQSALGISAGYVVPSGQPGSGVGGVAHIGRFGFTASVVEPPPWRGGTCDGLGCTGIESRPSLTFAASWAVAEQRAGQPARVELVAGVGLDRYVEESGDVADGLGRRRGTLGVVVSARADEHRPLMIAPFASARVEVAETLSEPVGRMWFGAGMGWGFKLGPYALGWVEARSELDVGSVGSGWLRTTLTGGLVGTF